MSPLEQIKQGIMNSSWSMVCDGYKNLTGETIELPPTIGVDSIAGKTLQKIIDILVDDILIESGGVALAKAATEAAKKKKPGRPKGKKKSTKNKPISADGKDDSLQLVDDKKTVVQKRVGTVQLITNEPDPEEIERNKAKAAKSARTKQALRRPATKSYDVKCSECEGTFKSDRPSGEMGQKCNKCLADKKSRFL